MIWFSAGRELKERAVSRSAREGHNSRAGPARKRQVRLGTSMGFDSFLGNSKAKNLVRGMLKENRVSGSLLFTGPEGVGKKTLALMLAKAINCERQNGDFCGKCLQCLKAEEMLAATGEDT